MNEMTYPEITLFPVALFSTLCCCPIEEEVTPTPPTCRMFRDEYLDLRIKYSIRLDRHIVWCALSHKNKG